MKRFLIVLVFAHNGQLRLLNTGKLYMKLNKRHKESVRLLKGDPPKGWEFDSNGNLRPIGWTEFHEEGDDSNYLNLARLDSIVQAPFQDMEVPFSAFRDKVRTVEAGPSSKSPYTQVQMVEVDGVMLPVGVGRGAYQFDYDTA